MSDSDLSSDEGSTGDDPRSARPPKPSSRVRLSDPLPFCCTHFEVHRILFENRPHLYGRDLGPISPMVRFESEVRYQTRRLAWVLVTKYIARLAKRFGIADIVVMDIRQFT